MNSKTILLVASTASMIKQFNLHNIDIVKKMGNKVIVAANFDEPGTIPKKDAIEFRKQLEKSGVATVQIDFQRGLKTPFKNISTYRQLNKYVENNQIDLIHSQTPIGGVVGRLVGHKNKIKNLYVVHGFHFFKGASILNWLAYPVEKYLSRYTDYLVTINQEDYDFAKSKLKIKNISKINSAGVDFKKIDKQVTKNKTAIRKSLRSQMKWNQDSTVMITVAELSQRKNISTAIDAFVKADQPDLNYLIVGKGPLEAELTNQIERLNASNRIKVVGYSDQVPDYLSASDFMLFISLREGLGLAGVEGLHFNLPVIGSNVRGIKDYVKDGKNGYLTDPKNVDEIAKTIIRLNDAQNRKKLASKASQSVENFDSKIVDKTMEDIYKKLLK